MRNFHNIFATLAFTIILYVVLTSYGQPLWCSCREGPFYSLSAWSTHTSQHLFDPYSLTHVEHGLIFFLFLSAIPKLNSVYVALGIETVWEALENSHIVINRYRTVTASLGYTGDSIANSIGDLLSCLIGYLIASGVSAWGSMALILMVEAFLLFTIHDCLILNIIMLIVPIKSIQEWQLKFLNIKSMGGG